MSDKAENMLIAGLDQDWASAIDRYNQLSPEDRGVLSKWLMRQSFAGAPKWVVSWIRALASIAFLETGLRWAKQQEQSDGE